jgi:glycosyltransferase involved in cell wall biosynthesis
MTIKTHKSIVTNLETKSSLQDGSQPTFFTIIIPTRERPDTLIHTIQNVLAQDYKCFEVLVSDNASDDQTKEVVENIQDTRLRYINTGKRVSMSKNWEFAISHVSHGWITVLGDDDGLLPGALGRVDEIIKKTGILAIRSNGCDYLWPSLLGGYFGQLSITSRNGYEVRNSAKFLKRVMDGLSNYKELPMLYNGGFVDLSLILDAKEKTGDFFLSMTPDVYSAIVLSYLTKNYVYSFEPLAINGASIHSGGTAGFEKVKRKRTYDPVKKFWSEDNIPFHKELPLTKMGVPVRSISVLVYESFLQANAFHGLKDIVTSHQEQLEIALRKSGPNHDEIVGWVNAFSSLHDLNIRYEGGGLRAFFKYTHFYDRFRSTMNYLFSKRILMGCERSPISNVFEASVAGGVLKVTKPSMIMSVLRKLFLRIGRLK